jgi:hypothetical protein
MMRDMRDFIDRAIECVFVCFRWFGESAQLSTNCSDDARISSFVAGGLKL